MADHPVIRTEGITRVYKTGDVEVHALRGVDLVIEPGEFVSIMGSSGSGKSTLMNVLGCLDYPTSGRFYLDGRLASSLKKKQLADVRNQHIGFVFQGFNLLPRTSAVENVELPLLYDRSGKKRNARKMALQALDRVGLGDRVHHHPSELSGGQQQRVAIARALVNEPSLILADEPTGNLDSRTGIEVLSVFQELNRQGITILLVTHEHDVAEYTQRVIEMKDGLIVADHPVTSPRHADDDLSVLDAPEVLETAA